jgi:DNA-binding HxlR family transcriptional regulator
LIARALEAVGERWGLLIVRDLLDGDRRFSDLERSCHGITPRQLSARLRQLEAAGLVERVGAEQARRYRLTRAGEDLRPVIESLLRWGIHHAREVPPADEVVRGYHILIGTQAVLNETHPPVRTPVTWVWRFPGDPQLLRLEDREWTLTRGDSEDPDLVIDATPHQWASHLMASEGERPQPTFHWSGSPERMAEFETVFGLRGSRVPGRK